MVDRGRKCVPIRAAGACGSAGHCPVAKDPAMVLSFHTDEAPPADAKGPEWSRWRWELRIVPVI